MIIKYNIINKNKLKIYKIKLNIIIKRKINKNNK